MGGGPGGQGLFRLDVASLLADGGGGSPRTAGRSSAGDIRRRGLYRSQPSDAILETEGAGVAVGGIASVGIGGLVIEGSGVGIGVLSSEHATNKGKKSNSITKMMKTILFISLKVLPKILRFIDDRIPLRKNPENILIRGTSLI